MTEHTMIRAAGGAGALSAQSLINAILGAAFFMFMARILTKEELGVYGAVTLICGIITVIGTLGLDYAASRYIPYFSGRNHRRSMQLTARYILTATSISALAVTGIYLALSENLSQLMLGNTRYILVFQVASTYLFTGIVSMIFTGFMQGIQRYIRIALYRLIAQTARVASSVWLLIIGLGVMAVFIGWTVFSLLFIALTVPLTLKLFRRPNTGNSGNGRTDEHFSPKVLLLFSAPMMGYNLVNYLTTSVDQFIVLAFVNIEALGAYVVAVTEAGFILTVLGVSIVMTLTPSMSELHGRIGEGAVISALTSSSRYIALFFTPVCLGLAALSPLAIHILAGAGYGEAILPLAVMSIGATAYGFSTAITSALIALGETRKTMVIAAAALAVELASSTALTYLLGIVGASMGRALMYLVMLLLLIHVGSKTVKIRFDREAVVKSFTASAVMALALYLFASATGFNLILTPAYLAAALVIYALALLALKTLTLGDVKFLLTLIPRGGSLYAKVRGTVTLAHTAKKLLKQ